MFSRACIPCSLNVWLKEFVVTKATNRRTSVAPAMILIFPFLLIFEPPKVLLVYQKDNQISLQKAFRNITDL